MNAQAANHASVVKSDADPVDFIKLDGTRTDSEGLFDAGTRLSQYTLGVL